LNRWPNRYDPERALSNDEAVFALSEPAPAVVAKFAALAERDPAVAQWGLSMCRDDAPCKAEAAGRWLRAEPDNALAWAHAIDQKSSPAALAEARAGMLKASRAAVHSGAFVGAALVSMPADIPPYVQQWLLKEAKAVEMSDARLPLSPLALLCPVPTDDTTRQQCDSIARLLVDRSDSLATHWSGLGLGKHMGWPAAEVATRTEAAQGLVAVFSATQSLQGESCEGTKAIKSWMTGLAEKGELAWLRERTSATAAATSSAIKR
jgi:hypothetical protein